MKIRFEKVGRDQRSWAENFDAMPTMYQLEACVRRSRTLLSGAIEVCADETGLAGVIYAGVHQVGTWSIAGD
jgi:hypothetical protein